MIGTFCFSVSCTIGSEEKNACIRYIFSSTINSVEVCYFQKSEGANQTSKSEDADERIKVMYPCKEYLEMRYSFSAAFSFNTFPSGWCDSK